MRVCAITTGQPYRESVTAWPAESSRLITAADHCELALFYAAPTAEEISLFERGRWRFAVMSTHGCGVLCYRAGDVPWAETPFEPWRSDGGLHDEAVPTADPLRFEGVLVDADTGLIAAARNITWPPDFSAAVAAVAAETSRVPAADAAHHLAALYQDHSSEEMAARAVATC